MKYITLLVTIVAFLFLSLRMVSAEQPKLFKVIRVVDGDTLIVDVSGKQEKVRLLGIDTPESVDPRRPVQCFGKEATVKLKSLVAGKSVILVDDKTQGDRDKYKRYLRYVYLPDSKRTFVNGEMVKQGYAFSYREYPTKMLEKFNRFESEARTTNTGLWKSCSGVPRAKVKTTATVDKDCRDFTTQQAAQSYFLSKGGSATNNVDRLDNNHDGIVCTGIL